VKVKTKYRKAGVGSRILAYSDVTLSPGTRANSGRKENITNSFKGFSPAEADVLSQ
jgi:hypothetical protein